jgi:DNA-binding winged helix-turn-helix (wHTH) protein/dipeptidyl aminopeptidase/acylaminoacyl peptidase
MSANHYEKIKVNEVEVDFVSLKLLVDGNWRDVEARQLNLLRLLIDNQGAAVSRDQIMKVLWQDTIVSDNSVSQIVTQLRKSLGDDKGTPRFIKTVPRIGYQLIAEIEYFQEEVVTKPVNDKKKFALVAGGSALATIGATSLILYLNQPKLEQPLYQYESRLTSVPGPESFLKYSPDGRYLAFSQMSANRRHTDLAVYDSKTQAVHSIKSTGYSEDAAQWSPDGKWLVYYRQDPLSCELRVMSVVNPVETWRLSPDAHLAYCQPGYEKQKIRWPSQQDIYVAAWQNSEPYLLHLSLTESTKPTVSAMHHYTNFRPLLFDVDANKRLLIVEKQQANFQLSLVNLQGEEKQFLEQSQSPYWGLTWHPNDNNYWIGSNQLKLKTLSGESVDIEMPMSFIADIDINPNTQQLAHAEGLLNINLYSATVAEINTDLVRKQLSSSTRTDVLPAVSNNGNLVAFVSYQQRSIDGLKHAEIWLKNKYKKTANLLVNLDESVTPYLLLWSPDNKNLLLVDTKQKLHLINVISKSVTPLLTDYQEISNVNWDKDGEHIHFSSNSDDKREQWRYSLTNKTTDVLPTKANTHDIKEINLTYGNYLSKVEQYLLEQVGFNLPVDDLMPSLQKFTPYVFSGGIYYVVKEGKQLKLYRYQFNDNSNKLVAHLGSYEQDLTISLNIASSADGKQIVFNSVDTMETDILVQRKQTTD